MSTAKNKVHFGQKVAFGLGMLANQMFPAALGIFMVVLVQNLGFPTWMWGILFFLPRVFDSITDPIMGFISDNTRSVWGRRRQYVFIGAIVMGISFSMMWQLYEVDSLSYNFTYFLLWSLVFYLGLTVFSVPYVAMGYEMSDDFHERTDIMAVAQWIGQWAWVIAPWFWVIMYDPDWFENAAVATRTIAIWVAVICAILAMIPAFFVDSKSTKDDDSLAPLTLKTVGGSLKEIVENFKEAFKIDDFKRLCYATFLIFNAFNTVAGFSFFIVVYYLFAGDAAAAGIWPTLLGSIGALVTTFLVIPIVARMSKKLGKKKAFLVSQGISILGYIMLWFLFVPGKPYLFLFALPFFSFGIGSLFTLMMSMTSDVIDVDELNTGKRREGVFGAIYWWMVKFGFAIAGLLTGAIMTLVGFVPDAENTEASVTGIRLFYSGLPIAGTLGAMWIMRKYELTEQKSHVISAELAKRRMRKAIRPTSSFYALNKLKSLIAINSEANYPTDVESELSDDDLAARFHQTLNAGVHGLCFSPYLEGQNIGDQLTGTQIDGRMEVIQPYTKWVRSFSCTDGNELIPVSARSKGIKSIAGAWISNDRDRNELEIAGLLKQAKSGMVDIAVVGNEVLLREDLSVTELIEYIRRVKAELPNLKVGYVDAYYQFVENPELIDEVDVILANCYPFWEGCHIDKSTAYLDGMYSAVLEVSQGKQVIVSETGWPNQGKENQDAVPSKENAMRYFINVNNWSSQKDVETFYFSSFDESWKARQEGEVGARWGIWDKNENLKY
ncbi:MFS transporter [Nonlabens agnitus]|uniref:Endo-1,3-beta-glucanase btgC n=1 Tax=Nonlabens agnitus TaxID=870484 RepID=A0A2S9WQN9_9FLAO|nr:MFS transporter [Nonlabens agnitus]PRP65781.1 glycosyl hydrolase [Nonlabens agnitus]